jgi:RND family efflux transporter MFP subunit
MNQYHLTVMLAVLLYSGCRQNNKQEETSDRKVPVEVFEVYSVEYRQPVRVSGMLAARKEMKLSFKTGGLIQKIYVNEGESVKEGQMMASLDLSEIKAQVRQAEVGVEKAARDLERVENLYLDSVATLEQYQNARSAYELALSKKQIADFNFSHSRIRAPSDGKVQKILMEVNEITGPGHPVLLFACTAGDWVVRVALTDKDVVKLTPGDSANVTMDAFPEKYFPGEVTELGAIADPVTGTYEAELLILRPEPRFRTGYMARAEIFPRETVRGWVVPLEALLDASDNRAYVYLVQKDRVVRQEILTGNLTGDGIIVLEGLEVGDRVVTEGNRYLDQDTRIEVVSKVNEKAH